MLVNQLSIAFFINGIFGFVFFSLVDIEIIYDDVFHLLWVQLQLCNYEQPIAQTSPCPMNDPCFRDLMHS